MAHPQPAVAVLAIAMLACGQPLFTPRPAPPPAPAPQPHSVSEITAIRQSHAGAFGPSPTWDVTLRRDGTAEYRGLGNVPMLGRYDATIDSTTFQRLAAGLVHLGFFRLAPYYGAAGTDHAYVATTVFYGTDSTFLIREIGQGPRVLDVIEAAIDSTAAQLSWSARPRRGAQPN